MVLRSVSVDAAPFTAGGSTRPRPVARMITVSPTLAGRVARPGIEPTGAARDPSALMVMACPVAVAKTPGETKPMFARTPRSRTTGDGCDGAPTPGRHSQSSTGQKRQEMPGMARCHKGASRILPDRDVVLLDHHASVECSRVGSASAKRHGSGQPEKVEVAA